MNHKLLWFAALFLPLLMFLLLAYKNPYAGKSLIGNFDPFPDSMHYVVPARNFAMGQGFKLSREYGSVDLEVPPLYSLTLIPGYIANHDSRTYYFTNIFLGIVSLILLYVIARKLSQSPYITGLVLFLYAGTYVMYWQTSLAMAENVLMPVLLMCIWLWLQPLSIKNILFSSIFAVACYGSKYVSLPLTASILLLLVTRILINKQKMTQRFLILGITSIVSLGVMSGSKLVYYAQSIIQTPSQDDSTISATYWLTPENIVKSFPAYTGALVGKPIYNLWSVRPILPPLIGAIVLLWCIYAILKLPHLKRLSVFLLVLTLSQLAFLSLIVMTEGRYAFVFLPLVYTGLSAMLGSILTSQKKQIFFVSIAVLLFTISSYKDWKLQLLLNFKGSEVSWWQVGMEKADDWLRETPSNSPPILLSTMNPFMWDFYREGEYQVLPYLQNQDFTQKPIWGVDPVPSDWRSYILEQAKTDRDVYISTVGFNPSQWKDFEVFQSLHPTTLINQDCNNSCRLYKINR